MSKRCEAQEAIVRHELEAKRVRLCVSDDDHRAGE